MGLALLLEGGLPLAVGDAGADDEAGGALDLGGVLEPLVEGLLADGEEDAADEAGEEGEGDLLSALGVDRASGMTAGSRIRTLPMRPLFVILSSWERFRSAR